MEIAPLTQPICATVRIPGSKSYTNRALILAAQTKGAKYLKHPLYSDDTEAMIDCLRKLGIHIETEPDQIIVHGDIRCVKDQTYRLFARDSGTTARFMLALLCIIPGIKIIEGSKRLNERPIKDLVEALRQLGALIEYSDREGCLPVKITSSTLSNHLVYLRGDISSQFYSALLLISPSVPNTFTIHITEPLISKPYIDMTLDCIQQWETKTGKRDFSRKKPYLIEGDFSSAGYFFAIAVLTKSTITVENLNPNSAQADRKLLEILMKMGNRVTAEKNSVRIEGRQLMPLDVSMEDCPDQVMTLAVLAAFAKGVTRISGVRSLRVKETERVLALKNELSKMGIETQDTHDTLTIFGGTPHAAEIETYQDHRIAMAFAVAGTHLPGMIIRNPEVVNKTFPTFWHILKGLK